MLLLSLLQALLESVTYSYTLAENEEPIEGERLVNITVSDGVFESSAVIPIDVVALNNHPPQITFSGTSNITFTEGETEAITLGSLLAPVVSDPDNNALFFMQSAAVQLLHATDGEFEELNFDTDTVATLGISVNRKSLLYYGSLNVSHYAVPKYLITCDASSPCAIGTHHMLTFSGSASVSSYQQALSTLTYLNSAPEPLPGTRLLSFTVFDGLFHSSPATATLSLSLINDNILSLVCGRETVVFQEGSLLPVPLTSQLTVVDLDHDHMIHRGFVNIQNPQEGDQLFLDATVTPQLQISVLGDSSFEITGTASDYYYQV